MRELALHILDIARNSIEAGATRLLITVIEDERADNLVFEVVDNGGGMSEEALKQAMDPFYTTRTTRRMGLGLSLLKSTCERCNGELRIKSIEGDGTHLVASLQYEHLDRPPVGDMGGVMQALACEAERVHLVYRHSIGGKWFSLDTHQLQYELDDVYLRSPVVLSWIGRHVNDSLRLLRREGG